MKAPAKWAVWALAGIGVLATLASIPFALFGHVGLISNFVIALVLGSIAMVLVGALLVTRIPGNAIGWIYLTAGTIYAFVSLAQAYAQWSFMVEHRALPLAGIAAWWAYWAWLTAFTLFATLGFLLFPDGKPPSRRWRPLAWICWASVAGTCFIGIAALGTDPARLVLEAGPDQGPNNIVGLISLELFPLLVLASAASLVVRFIRSSGDQRRQIAWFVLAAAALVISFTLQQDGGNILSTITVPAVPIAAGIGILKYRLYDIDIVVRKTVVIGLTAGFITLVYVAIVAGVGALVGQQGNATLSAAAAAVVALAFLPVRQRARHIADRVVYGKRATPYETLTEFAGNAANTLAVEEVLPQMARALGEGTGASLAAVWLRVGGSLEREGIWPAQAGDAATARRSASMIGVALPDLSPAQRVTAVRHQAELLGALTLSKPASDPITPADEKLMDDLAEQAGLVLRNARLVEELRASRQRLVAAQDEERRKIERNLHDGAQQQLIALAIKVNLAQSVAAKDPAKAVEIMGDVKSDLQDSVDTLRDLARGIYPPLLADQGLAVALDAQAKKAAVPTTVEANGLGRYPQEVEAAVYFCALEALQNIAKYANATHAEVRLRSVAGILEFEVTDDGAGFDTASTSYGTGLQGMADRLDAIGGRLEIDSSVGKGTTITGRVRAAPAEQP